MSTIKTETLSTPSNATVPVDTVVNGTAKAWVNFNGSSTVAIRRAFNVSSITDNGTGNYTVNFTTAMQDSDYVLVGAAGEGATSLRAVCPNYDVAAPTTTAARIQTPYANGALADVPYVNVAFMG
jgi:hypothetical protein